MSDKLRALEEDDDMTYAELVHVNEKLREIIDRIEHVRTSVRVGDMRKSEPRFWGNRIKQQTRALREFDDGHDVSEHLREKLWDEYDKADRRVQAGHLDERAYYPNGSRMSEARRKW